MVTGLVIIRNGHTWEEIAEAGQRGLSSIVSAIFILLAVGALIGNGKHVRHDPDASLLRHSVD